jgi:hypothetical protein
MEAWSSSAALRVARLEHTVFALCSPTWNVPRARRGATAAQIVWVTWADRRTLVCDGGQPFIDAHRRGTPQPGASCRRARCVWQVAVFCAGSLAVFLLAVFNLDPVVRWLWPIPVAMFVVYPYLKRMTWLSHAWLGATLGLAPVGGWVAMTGELPLAAWLLGAGVAAWVAG